MRGPKPQLFDNQAVMEFLWQFDDQTPHPLLELPRWVEHCIVGASRIGPCRPSSPNAILKALKQLPIVSTETATNFVNRKRLVLGKNPYSKSYCNYFYQRVRAASKAIAFHYERIEGSRINPHI